MELNYYDKKGERKTIECELRFLTPKLRVEILKFNNESQLAFKKFQKEVSEHVAKLKAERPELSDEELRREAELFTMTLLAGMTDAELRENNEKLQKTWRHNDEWTIRFFKMIVDYSKLSGEAKKLIGSEVDSEFWQNVDIGGIGKINSSFRRENSI